jgi:UDP:flavonoid glycosyltransferase YjiC (YdhE family)
MHAMLVTMGTDGDVFPFVGLGARLRGRGHRVTLAGTESYQGLAAQHGLGFHCLGETRDRSHKSLKRPNMWNKMPGAVLSGRL